MEWGGWMEEGGQAERSTRGGLRGLRGPRGEKLEKGRFKYQPPRGGPRVGCLYLASSLLVTPSFLYFTLSLSFSRSPLPCYHSLTIVAVLRLYTCTHIQTKKERERVRAPYRKICAQTDAHAHIYRSSAREKASQSHSTLEDAGKAVLRANWTASADAFVLRGPANFLDIMMARMYVYYVHMCMWILYAVSRVRNHTS